MTFDPLSLLTLAGTLNLRNEAGARTAINRAYYSVFLKARDSLLVAGLLTDRGPGQTHGEVLFVLRSNRRREAARVLTELRVARELADYDTTSTIGEAEAEDALLLAEQVGRLLARDWETA